MKSHTEYLVFETKKRREMVHITDEVEDVVRRSGVKDGLCFVSPMHITAAVYVNDHESGLIEDIGKWLEELAPARPDYKQTLSNQVATHTVSIQMGHDGLVISLREAGFFPSGSAAPKPETLATLRQIALSLSHTPYDLRIEGHTDNIPIHNSEFDSNWELSTARATRIARLVLALNIMPANRLSAAGYAEFHPVASNDSATGRSENRRVDLIILPRNKIDLSAPSSSSPPGVWRKITDE